MLRLLILLMFLSVSPAIAEMYEPVYLQGHTKLEFEQEDYQMPGEYKLDSDLVLPQQKIYNDDLYSSKSASFLKEKQMGNFSIGTKTDSVFSPDKYTQTNTYYTKYQKNRFALSTSYKNNALTSFESQRNGTFMFSPEYKLNNKVTLQSIYSTSFIDRSRKNELLFNIHPFQDDRMNFNVGASQIYSTSVAPARSQVNFSTKFNF